MTTTTCLIQLDDNRESQEFTAPRYDAPVFFRQSEVDGPIHLAYAADGTPTRGNQYEEFATISEAEDFARRNQFAVAV